MCISDNINELPALPPLTFLTEERIQSVTALENDVLKYLRMVNPNKSSGPDGISNHILKFCADSLYKPITKLFNYTLQLGVFPPIGKSLMCVQCLKIRVTRVISVITAL